MCIGRAWAASFGTKTQCACAAEASGSGSGGEDMKWSPERRPAVFIIADVSLRWGDLDAGWSCRALSGYVSGHVAVPSCSAACRASPGRCGDSDHLRCRILLVCRACEGPTELARLRFGRSRGIPDTEVPRAPWNPSLLTARLGPASGLRDPLRPLESDSDLRHCAKGAYRGSNAARMPREPGSLGPLVLSKGAGPGRLRFKRIGSR